MQRVNLFFLAAIGALLFLSGCATAAPVEPTTTPKPPLPTETPAPTEVPLPTETALPLETPAVSETAIPTETAMQSETPVPTEMPLPNEPGIYGRYLPGAEETSYTIYLPNGYDPTVAYPLVVSLHYAGYNGPGYGADLLQAAMISGFEELNPIIVAPDSPNWRIEQGQQTAINVTNFILENYVIDRERVVLAGYSNGGAGTWLVAAEHQDTFTAAVPMAALPMDNAAGIEWQIPILYMISEADELFDFEVGKRRASQLKESGANISLYPIKDVSHYRADLYPELIQDALPWLLAQWED